MKYINKNMKIIITERQYNILLEQPDSKMPFQIEKFGYKQGKPETTGPALERQREAIQKIDPHTVLLVAQIATAFIPVVGIFISAGLGFMDAALYYNDGDKKTAGMVAMFSVLPLLGKVVSKIPAISKLGQKGMKALSTKLVKGGTLTADELNVVNGLSKEQSLITQELNQYSKNIANKAINKVEVADNKTRQALINITKSGLKFSGVVGAYTGIGVAYDKVYDKYWGAPSFDLNTPPPESSKKTAAEIKW
jgi:hypothetical protein